MPHRIRISVHHQKTVLTPGQDQIPSVVAATGRFGQKIARVRLCKIFEAPGRPKRFQLDFWEIHSVANVENRERKSSLSPAGKSQPCPERLQRGLTLPSVP